MPQPSFQEMEQQLRQGRQELPRHIGFIMDGNGRWAKSRKLPRVAGHGEGVSSVREMVEVGVDLGIDVMTFYTFSTENWRRPAFEVSALMKLLVSTIRKEVDDLDENNVTLRTIGRFEDLPDGPRKELQAAIDRLSSNDGLVLTLALSYGGRQDILRAMKRLMDEGKSDFTEEDIALHLDTAGLPDPDLIIRTSGEYRLSNFLIWQAAYSELYVTDTFWPDFRREALYHALWDYLHRERRFGCTSEQLAKP